MPSSIPDAEAQLVTALQARSDLANALIQEGLPTDIPKQTERLYLLGVDPAQRVRATQQGGKHETFTMPVLIEVRGYGNTRAATKTRAWAIVEELEDALEDDDELGGTVKTATTGNIVAPAARPTEDGWLMDITVDVVCESDV